MPAGLSFGLGIGTTATYADSRPGQPGTGRCDVALSSTVRTAFEQVLPPDGVIADPVRCRAYECDGLTGYRVVPELVLLPRDAAQVAAAVRVCAEHGVPFVARGAGTGLSGGALPVADGVVISLARLKRVLEVDPVDRRAVVEPGVTNLDITAAAAPQGLYFAPDPSSQQVCTIGGNVAENSGGAHCLKYGFTTNHVLSAEVVLPDGSVVTLGGDDRRAVGTGSARGVRRLRGHARRSPRRSQCGCCATPESVRTLLADFPSVRAAGDVVSDIVAAGIVPAAVEMIDTLAIEAAEEAVHAGYTVGRPRGPGGRARRSGGGVRGRVRAGQADLREAGCTRLQSRAAADERARSGRVARPRSPRSAGSPPTTSCRTAWYPAPGWARCSAGSGRWATRPGCGSANVFHAGDGNLHPLVLYSAAAGRDRAGRAPVGRDRGAVRRAGRFAVRRARHRHGQGLLDAQDVRRGRPRDDGSGAHRLRPARSVQSRARCCPRRGCAASGPGSTDRIRWRRQG